MSGQILQPNYTISAEPGAINTFQSAWRYDTASCFRPAADLAIPIACVAYGSPQIAYANKTQAPSLQSLLGYNLFEKCCPQPEINRTQIYMASRSCASAICFTTEESIAKGFDQCVKEKGKYAFEESKQSGDIPTDAIQVIEPYGRCEYVDYEMLKKGVVKDSKSEAEGQKIRSAYLTMALAIGVLSLSAIAF